MDGKIPVIFSSSQTCFQILLIIVIVICRYYENGSRSSYLLDSDCRLLVGGNCWSRYHFDLIREELKATFRCKSLQRDLIDLFAAYQPPVIFRIGFY